MKVFQAVLLGAAFVVLTSAAAAAQAAKVAQGEALYAAQKCSLCHSVAGKGNKKFPLDGVGKTITADIVKLWLSDPKAAEAKTGKAGTPKMRPYAKLSADEVDALVAYMLSLK